jgi:hypothetical protein
MKRHCDHSLLPPRRRPLTQVLRLAVVAVVLAAACSDDPEPTATDATRPPVTEPGADGTVPEPSRATSYRGLRYDGAVARNPTAGAPQSKLWFHDGSWWGVLFNQPSGEFRIHWLEWGTQTWHDTGTLVDERPSAKADVLWDGGHLFVASAGSGTRSRHAARIHRFTYDPATRRFGRDPDFPVTLSPAGVSEVSVVRDGAGTLWASYVQGGRVHLVRSLANDAQWGDPFVLPAAAEVAAEQLAMTTYGDTVGVLWANGRDDAVHYATHAAGAPDGEWEAATTEIRGFGSTKNDLALSVLPGEGDDPPLVFAAAKSAPEDSSGRNRLGPQLLVLGLRPDGTWRQHVAGQIRDEHAQPVLSVDREQRLLYVFATHPTQGGAIHYKVARADRIAFAGGPGTAVIAGGSDRALVHHASSTKQPVDASTGLVVLASDDVTGTYLHATFDLGGQPAGKASAGDREPRPTGSPAGGTDVLSTSFDPLAPGRPLDPGWTRDSLDPDGTVAVATFTSPTDHSARAVAGPTGADLQVCRLFAPASGGDLSVEVDVLLDGPAIGSAVLTSIRGDDEVANVRLGSNGRFGYTAGALRPTLELRASSGVWYRSSLVVHLATKTYDWQLRDRASGAVLHTQSAIPWASTVPSSVERLCLRTPEGPGASLVFDNLRIRR